MWCMALPVLTLARCCARVAAASLGLPTVLVVSGKGMEVMKVIEIGGLGHRWRLKE